MIAFASTSQVWEFQLCFRALEKQVYWVHCNHLTSNMALGPHRQSRPVRSVAQGFPVRWLVSTQATAWHGRYNSPTKSGRRVWRYSAHIQKREYSSPYSFFWQSSVRLSGVSGELKLPRGLCMPLSLVLETQGFELSSTRPEIRKPNARFKRILY